MAKPENNYNYTDDYQDTINIDPFLKKPDVLNNKTLANKKESKMLTAYIITISKQMEKLLTTTERMIETKKFSKQKNINLYIISGAIGFTLIFSMITYSIFSKKYDTLKNNLDNKLQHSFSKMEEIVTQQTKYLKNSNTSSNNTDRTFFINRLDKIEKNILLQNKNFEIINEKMTNTDYTQNNTQNKTKNILINNIIEKKLKTIEQKISHNEKKQKISSILDILQKTKKKTSFKDSKDILYANAYAKRAWQHNLNNDYDKAIEEYKRALTLNPKFAMAYYNIACMYTKLHQRKNALEWLKKGKVYFDNKIIETAKHDPDLAELRQDPYFSFIIAN